MKEWRSFESKNQAVKDCKSLEEGVYSGVFSITRAMFASILLVQNMNNSIIKWSDEKKSFMGEASKNIESPITIFDALRCCLFIETKDIGLIYVHILVCNYIFQQTDAFS